MPPQPCLDEAACGWVALMRRLGFSQRAIAGELGVSASVISRTISRLCANGQLEQPEFVDGLDAKRYRSHRETA